MTKADPDREYPRISLRGLFILVTVLCVLVGIGSIFFRVVKNARRAATKTSSHSSFIQLRLALENYHDVYGSFPPPCSVDANGKPLLSWRVHILPFIEHQHLYSKFNLTQPWDSPTNKPLIAEMPETFTVFDDESLRLGHTAICGVVGDHTLFRPNSTTTRDDVTDGKETIVLVEVTGSGIPWTAPRDLDFDTMSFELNDPNQPSLSSPHWRRPLVRPFEGISRELPADITPAELRALLTIDAND